MSPVNVSRGLQHRFSDVELQKQQSSRSERNEQQLLARFSEIISQTLRKRKRFPPKNRWRRLNCAREFSDHASESPDGRGWVQQKRFVNLKKRGFEIVGVGLRSHTYEQGDSPAASGKKNRCRYKLFLKSWILATSQMLWQ
jgi:hypothetical protein